MNQNRPSNPIADFAQALNPRGGALGPPPFTLTGGHSEQDAPRPRSLFEVDPPDDDEEERRCRDCGRRPDVSVEDGGCTCPGDDL